MSKITDLIDALAATTKKNEKIKILEATKKDPELEQLAKDTFKAAYDTSINYWIRSFPDKLPTEEKIDFSTSLKLLSALSDRMVTGNKALDYAANIAAQLNSKDEILFRAVVARDLRCGATASTANKVWPGLVPDHPYMRCSSFNEKNLKNISFPCYSQTKADGLYIDIIVSTDAVIYRTRNGQTLALNNPEIDEKLKTFVPGWVLMGEALVIDENSPTGYCDRKTGNGILNSDDIDVSRLAFVLWDAVEYTEWTTGEGSVEYADRLLTLTRITSFVGDPLRLVDTKEVSSVEEIIEHFRENVEKGEEGVVIKDRSGKWKDGTSKYQVKVKIVAESEFEVKQIVEGSGKYKGKLGAVCCESSDGVVLVSAGSGFSDKDRETFWQNKEDILNKIITIKYNDLIQNKNNSEVYSLFLPRFVCLREDKDLADNLQNIKDDIGMSLNVLRAAFQAPS